MRRLRDEDLSPYEPVPPRRIDWIEILIRAVYGILIGLGVLLFFFSNEVFWREENVIN